MEDVEIIGASVATDGSVEFMLTGQELPEVHDNAQIPSMTAMFDVGQPFTEALKNRPDG